MTGHSRLAAAGIMAAIFVSGAVAGGAVTRLVIESPAAVAEAGETNREGSSEVARGERDGERGRRGGNRGSRPGEPRSFMDERAYNRLTAHLDMTDEQKIAFDGVLEQQRQAGIQMFAELGPQMRAMLDSTNSQVRRLLTADQQVEFDRMITEDRGLLGRRFGPPSGRNRRDGER